MRLGKNFRTKKKKFWPVSDLAPNPGFGSGFESGSETNFRPDPDPKLFFRIRNTELKDRAGCLSSKYVPRKKEKSKNVLF
jgi:hypothetical protein